VDTKFKGLMSLVAICFATASAALDSDAIIDEQMAGEVDFRDLAFAGCAGKTECSVSLTLPEKSGEASVDLSLIISAEHNTGILGGWFPAEIYWDPVDGFGVMGGGQNDEIDFNERLTIQLDTPARLGGMWMSDMFIYEHINYGASYSVQDDLEAADIRGFLAGEQVFETRVTGRITLPDDPFNSLMGDIFMESGDLLNRALIDEGSISILIRDEDGLFSDRIIRAVIGEVDPAKTDIFDGVQVVEIDLETLLGDAEFAPLLAGGNINAAHIEQIMGDQVRLASLQGAAERQRLISDVPNGEVGVAMAQTPEVDTLVFSAELQTSNDYSVVGFLVER